jgi:hypothetical protein
MRQIAPRFKASASILVKNKKTKIKTYTSFLPTPGLEILDGTKKGSKAKRAKVVVIVVKFLVFLPRS